jgi:endonuclease/exonuclease/phosphatase family metal-dependent hydrolase
VDGSIAKIRDMSVQDYAEELAFYADLIRSRQIDLVAISEIENEQVAQEFAAKLGQEWRHYFKQGLDTATGQDVAILSRLAYVEGSLTHFNFPSAKLNLLDKPKKITKLVGAQFWWNHKGKKEKLGVITAHFLSKRNENRHKAENRQKQAMALRQAVALFAEQTDKIIVLGDFNDQIDSATLAILTEVPLASYAACDNFQTSGADMQLKKWRRNIDHILFAGLNCLSQEKIDLQKYSDHDAISGVFTPPR